MKYLFWNTQKKISNNVISDIVNELSCDIISLIEYNGKINEQLMELNKNKLIYFKVNDIANKRIKIITKFKPSQIEDVYDAGYFTIKVIPHEELGKHIVTFVHFPSKIHADERTISVKAQFLKSEIERIEKEQKCDKTIIMGDFNMNPYEPGMLGASTLHGLSSRKIVKKEYRTVLNKKYSMFYNPMWNFMGDINLPEGTYFYNNCLEVNNYWNIFDQVLIRSSLIESFNPFKVKILCKTSNHDLINKRGKPDKLRYSDHLPVYFEL